MALIIYKIISQRCLPRPVNTAVADNLALTPGSGPPIVFTLLTVCVFFLSKTLIRFKLALLAALITTIGTGNMTEDIMLEQESQSDKLSRKSKEAPMFPIAIGILSLAVGYGAYMFKNKGKMSTSVYLMQLRVGAQGAAVGALTVGLAYTMWKQYVERQENAANEK